MQVRNKTMMAIIGNLDVWPPFMVSLLESGKRERRGCTAGHGYALALRGKAAFGHGYGVSANGNPVSSKKASGTGKSGYSSCNAAPFDGYSSAADRCAAGGNNFHRDLSARGDRDIEGAGCAACDSHSQSVRQVAGFNGGDVLRSGGNIRQGINPVGVAGSRSAGPTYRGPGDDRATGSICDFARHRSVGRSR